MRLAVAFGITASILVVQVVGALLTGSLALVVGVYVLFEGVRRLVSPTEVAGPQLVVFGAVGLLGNVAAIIVLAPGRSGTLNRRAAFLEVVNDALRSVAVIVAAVVIELTGWTRADAVVGLLIGVLILPRTLALLRETVDVLLESTPQGLDLDDVRVHLLDDLQACVAENSPVSIEHSTSQLEPSSHAPHEHAHHD